MQNAFAISDGPILMDPTGTAHTLLRVTDTKGCNNKVEFRPQRMVLLSVKAGHVKLPVCSGSRGLDTRNESALCLQNKLRRSASAASVAASTGTVSTMPTLK